jgi:ABC-type dipeptide/oligopeptide/nickel transport system ATPase component
MRLDLSKIKENQTKKEKESEYPIAIVKGNKKCIDFNKLVYLNTETAKNIKGSISVDIPYDCSFEILPNTDENKRDVFYVAGASGSGKSYIATQIAKNYNKLYPDREIFIVSKLDDDSTINNSGLNIQRIDWRKLINNFDINIFFNCMVIFDDCDTIEGKEGKLLKNVIDDIAIMGRKHTDGQGNITLLFLTHYLTNYKSTRLILNEATHLILYPQNSSYHQLLYILKNYVGLDDDETKQLKKLGSRWICIHKNYPQYIISQFKVKILNQDEEEEIKPKKKISKK